MKTDILIVGSGCAGLYCALNLPEEKDVLVITKAEAECNDSYLAQGGMCMLKVLLCCSPAFPRYAVPVPKFRRRYILWDAR